MDIKQLSLLCEFRSIIVNHLLSTFDDSETAVAWIYLNYRANSLQTSRNLLGSLLQQLVGKRLSVSRDVRKLYEEHHSRGSLPGTEAIFYALSTEIATCTKIFIVVDALDEVESRTRAELLDVLRSLEVNLLITSRPLPEIEIELKGSKTLEIRTSNIENDVRRFVDAELPTNSPRHSNRLHRLLKKGPGLQEFMINKIVKNSGGM